jgi:hypothetical protein
MTIGLSYAIITRSRRMFARRQVLGLLEQYRECDQEVVVFDNSPRGPDEMLAALSQYEWSGEFVTCGAARNRAVRKTRGEWVVFIDDDDWYCPSYGPHRVSDTWGNDLGGIVNPWRYELRDSFGCEWLDDGPLPGGGSLVAKREYWIAHPFDDITHGEDTMMLLSAQKRGDRLAYVGTKDQYVYIRHGINVTARLHDTVCGKLRVQHGCAVEKTAEVRALFSKGDVDFYDSVSELLKPASPPTPTSHLPGIFSRR